MHRGPLAALIRRSCWAGVSPMPLRFFGTGGSLAETGLVATSPHLIARAKALDTTPAMLRTVFADTGQNLLLRHGVHAESANSSRLS